MKSKNIRRIIVSIVVISTMIVLGLVIKSYMEKKYSKEAFQSINITFTKNTKKDEENKENAEGNENNMKTVNTDEKYSKSEILEYLSGVFPKERNIAIEEINFFGNEFRIKANEIKEEEREKVKAVLNEKYNAKDVSVGVGEIKNYPKRQENEELVMYVIYISVILLVNFAAIYFIDLSEKRNEI